MKALKLAAAVFAVLVFFLLPNAALADDDDFEVEYEIWPQDVGYEGADVQIKITVTNTGATDLTWLNVTVNTTAHFSHRWTGTIVPGAHRTLTFIVPFAQSDIEVDRLLQVAMNNNTSANPDGVKMFTFQVDRIQGVMSFSRSISPDQPTYNIGDTVTITHRYKNMVATHAELNVHSRIIMRADGDVIYEGTEEDLGDVFPDNTLTTSFRHTFGAEDAGEVRVTCRVSFSLMGRDYDLERQLLTFSVQPAVPAFTAALEAEPTVIDAGDYVLFHISFSNTGDYETDFSVEQSDGFEVASMTGAPAGYESYAEFNIPIDESCDVYYVVKGTIGSDSVSVQTNTVHITVRETITAFPFVSPSPVPDTSVPGTSGSVSASPSSSALSEPLPSNSGFFARVSPTEEGAEASGLAQPAGAAAGNGNTLVYILIGVAVLLAGSVTALFILLKKKSSK